MSSPDIVVDLIRHAESEMNVNMANPHVIPFIGGRENHIDLSENGESQARGLGYYALDTGLAPSRVFSSPALRSRRTEQLSSEVMGLTIEPVVDDRLQELDQGDWTNQPRTLYDEPANKKEMARLLGRFAPPNGESMRDVSDRMDDFFSSLEPSANAVAPEYIWVHTHGVAIKAWIGRLQGWSHEQTYKTHVDNVSRTRVVKQGGQWSLVFFNQLSG